VSAPNEFYALAQTVADVVAGAAEDEEVFLEDRPELHRLSRWQVVWAENGTLLFEAEDGTRVQARFERVES
jgi:hypothetical protein